MPPRRIAPPPVSWPGPASAQAKPRTDMPPNPVRQAPERSALPPPPFAPLRGTMQPAAQAKPRIDMPANPVRQAPERSALPPPPFAPLRGTAQPAAQAKAASVIQPMQTRGSIKKQTEKTSKGPQPKGPYWTRSNSEGLSSNSKKIQKVGSREFTPPPQCPRFDKHSNRLLREGRRKEVSWISGFPEWYRTNNLPIQCNSTTPTTHSTKMEIDHIMSFFDLIENSCNKHLVCDGNHHWDAYIIDFHDEILLPGQIPLLERHKTSVRRAYHWWNNLQWLCQTHNGSKNGTKDPDEIAKPDWIEICPAKDPKLLIPCNFKDPATALNE